ncbi:MAG: TauD/TfdA family dioxygenase [Sphingomonadaceae bacterium]|nr:TauD/TfdA family dioxygenase [Sphingomonadaceae bacterium]
MLLELERLTPKVGLAVSGIDIRAPLADEDQKALYRAYLDSGVLLFRNQPLEPEQLINFSRIFGDLTIHPIESIRLRKHPEIIKLGSEGKPDAVDDGSGPAGSVIWHSDMSYTSSPNAAAVLHAMVVPPKGGQTGFIDTAAVYDALSPDLREEIEGLEVRHDFGDVIGKQLAAMDDDETCDVGTLTFDPVIHPLVSVHSETGRKSVNLSPLFAKDVIQETPSGKDLLERLTAFATQPEFFYFHDWKIGDTILWDNRRTLHSAPGYDKRHTRIMYRTTIGAPPS